ncbi:hypothetical protein P4J60_29670 [Bacillus cereus]|nr:hypothetical protein [Bacillus cereus]MEB9571357.1 hypothetical protein [Bacillus cereus]
MDPWTVATMIIEAAIAFEKNKKEKEQRKQDIDNIISSVYLAQKQIEEVIERMNLHKAKGHLKAFAHQLDLLIRNHEECIYCTGDDAENELKRIRDNFEELNERIDPLIFELENYSRSKDETLTVAAFPIYNCAIALAIAVYTQRKVRFNYYLADEIVIKFLNSNIETQHEIENYIFTLEQKLGDYYFKLPHPGHRLLEFAKNMYHTRGFTEQTRYLYLINLNADFLNKSTNEQTAYGGFNFRRCSQFSLKDIEDRQVLAVNNKGGDKPNPSFYKRISGIYGGVELSFDVTMKSLKPGRQVELAIFETDLINGKLLNEKREQIELSTDWSNHSISLPAKLQDTSVIDFEVYWFDNEDLDILVNHTYVHLTFREYKLPDPYLPYLFQNLWTKRCDIDQLIFDISNDSISTQYIKANDAAKTHPNPSVYQDLEVYRNKTNKITFEALIKSKEDIGRQIVLAIWDFKGDYPGGPGRKAHSTGKYTISSSWNKFSIEAPINPSVNIRCEIYWFDNEDVDLLVKDARAIYTPLE